MEEILDNRIQGDEYQNRPNTCFLRVLSHVVGSGAFLFPLLTLTILVHVVLRYVCRINVVWLEELHW